MVTLTYTVHTYWHTYLVKVRCWFALPNPIEILHIDQLVVIAEAWVGNSVLWPACYVG